MRLLLALSRLIDALNDRIGLAISWALLAAVAICTGNAVVRYTLHMGSNAWLEIQWYLFAAVFLLAAAHTLRRNEHVRVDILAGRLSKRAQAWIDIVGFLLFLVPMCLIVLRYAVPYVMYSWQAGEMSVNAGGLIVWPVKALIPVAFLMLLCQGLSEVIKRVGFLLGMVAGAFVVGWLVKRLVPLATSRAAQWAGCFAACVVGGIVVVYAVGIPWLAATTGMGLHKAMMGSLVFLPGDLIKAAVTAVVAVQVRRAWPMPLR